MGKYSIKSSLLKPDPKGKVEVMETAELEREQECESESRRREETFP